MSDWRPFIVRRMEGGDVLRADDDAWSSALRYGARVVTPEEVEGTRLYVKPYYYDSAMLTVQIALDIEWDRALVVRGGFGHPTTPQDGVSIWYTEDRQFQDIQGVSTEINVSQQVLDTPLTAPNWYYYSLFLWVGNQWVRTRRNAVLVPKEHGWSEVLFNAIPPFYQSEDNENAADGRNGPLRKWTRVLGYDLDYTQCWADGVMNMNSVDKAPAALLYYLGENMGFPFEDVLGGNRTRSVLEQLDDLNSLRGTRLGLQRLVIAASDYGCTVQSGNNELLAVDDGDFHGGGGIPNIDPTTLPTTEMMRWGIGHWDPLTNSSYLTAIIDPVLTTENAGAAVSTPAVLARNLTPGPSNILTPPGGRGSMVVNGPGPETVIVCGHISPTIYTTDLYGAMTSGVPTRPGALYEFSAYLIRTGWGSVGQQPPQARVILGIIWFDDQGNEIQTVTGPVLPGNYDTTTWQRQIFQAFAPATEDSGGAPQPGGYYACPFIWWRHVGSWSGAWADANTPPTYGRYVSMAAFGRVAVEGADVVPISPDVYLTLGVLDKTLGGPESRLGEPSS